MDNLFVIREKMRELYAAHSRVFDKGIQFVLALVTFYLINGNVGFMKAAASPDHHGTSCYSADSGTYVCSIRFGTGSYSVDFSCYVYFLFTPDTENGNCSIADTNRICVQYSIHYSNRIRSGCNTDQSGSCNLWNDCILYDGICEESSSGNGKFRESKNDDRDYCLCKAGVSE